MPPRAVLFDAYGTLFDVHAVAALAESLFPGHGAALSALWRERQIEYTRLTTMSERAGAPARYRPFWELTQAALRQAAARLALPLDGPACERLLDAYRHLDPFPENAGVLQALHARGVRTGVLSNADPPMLQAAVRGAGFEAWLDPVLSVDAVRRFKTDPAAYALGPQALGLPAHEILFVSSNAWDALGATWFGYRTLWVNRHQAPPETLGPPPTHTGTSLRDVLAVFDAADAGGDAPGGAPVDSTSSP